METYTHVYLALSYHNNFKKARGSHENLPKGEMDAAYFCALFLAKMVNI
jgi:hypothetical protein